MKNLLMISFKNVIKSKERAVLTFLILAFGAMFYVYVYGLLGALLNISSNDTRAEETADIRIRIQNFDEENPLSQTNLFPANDAPFVQGGYTFTPRLMASAEADNYKDVLPINLVGIDPARDGAVFGVKTSRPEPVGDGYAWVGSALAQDLKLKEGDFINITFRTLDIDGESATISAAYEIGALLSSNNPIYNEKGVMIDINELQSLLGTNLVSYYSVRLPDIKTLNADAAALQKSLPNNEVVTWEYLTKEARESINIRKQFMGVFIMMIVLITLIGLMNTILISVWEKRKTTGTLRALGYSNQEIITLFVFEGLWIGFIGALIGTILGVLLNIPLVIYGINMEQFLKMGGETMNVGFYIPPVLKSQWDIPSIITPIIFMPLAAMLVSIYPARRSIKMSIVDCLRNKD